MAYSYQGTLSVSEDGSSGLLGELNYGVQSLSPVSTSDYNTLTNKPRINNVELIGNVTTERLGIRNGEDGFSPVITERETELGYDLTITDVEGSNTITLKNGTNGINGTNGQDGKSAYDIAVEQGFVGTEQEWLESLKGQDGIVMDAPSDGKAYARKDSAWVETVEAVNVYTKTEANEAFLPKTTVIPTKTSELTNDSGFITSIPEEYVTNTDLSEYAKIADVDTKLADYYKKTETYSNTEIDGKFTNFETTLTDNIKTWVNSEESLAIKTALYDNNTLMFYKKPNATVYDTADFSINLPEEQFLDQTKTTFINNFVWSEELYPNSTNPNLNNQPVLVLAVKGDTNVVYSFVSMNELVKIYKASTTVSTVTLVIDDATNMISAEVNISADEGNLLKIGTDGGLYAKATVDNTLSDTSENPVQNKVINAALNSKANLSDIPTTLPANGGNADTVGNKGISQILAVKGYFSGDMDNLKEQGSYIANEATNMPISVGWGTALVYAGGTGSVVQVFTAYVTSASDLCKTYIRHFTGDLWSTWVNIANGGNADTVGGLHAADLFQKSEGLRSENMYYDIFSTTLTSDHPCWNKHCFVFGVSDDIESELYIDNAPEISNQLWYEVFTCGTGNRAYQIAFGCYTNQRKTFIRYMHDWVWSSWYNVADGGNATSVGTYTEAKIAALEARIAALEGGTT